jgi:hypothetical protein
VSGNPLFDDGIEALEQLKKWAPRIREIGAENCGLNTFPKVLASFKSKLKIRYKHIFPAGLF